MVESPTRITCTRGSACAVDAVRNRKKERSSVRLNRSPCAEASGDNLRLAKVGGARRDRTADLLHAMQALSQLSYGPIQSPRVGCVGDERGNLVGAPAQFKSYRRPPWSSLC